MDFCEKCGGIMFPSILEGRKVLSCKCGNFKQLNEAHYNSYKLSKQIEHSLKEELVTASQIDKWKQGEDFDYPKISNEKKLINQNSINKKSLTSEESVRIPQEKFRTTQNLENKKLVKKSDILRKTEPRNFKIENTLTILNVNLEKESEIINNDIKSDLNVPDSSYKKINDTLNKWLNKVIDLSRRNRQLYFRRTKTSTVELIKPSPEEIFDLLVNKREELTIIYRDLENLNKSKKEKTDNIDSENIKDPLEYKKPLRRGEILTDKEDKELYKSMRTLLSRSRSSFQEQGVNVLFLAFGFLEWKDTSFSESTNRSPLILVPVLLKRKSLLQPYKIQFFDDDILINPALRVKFENDFKIKLPQLEEDIENIEEIFKKIASIIFRFSEAKNWKIHKDVYLSFFSFSKLMMYRDLKDNKEMIQKHEILNNLILENSKEQIEYLSGEELDQKNSIDIFHILDADSSQQNAILNAEKGKTFSIQGPPGTGKSQTIANIIASSLVKGKKVLFVSEKMAALEVVMKRLEECGFDEFCLELHSFKSNKKTVYEELGRCLLSQEEFKNPQISFLNELDQTKMTLNDYFKSVVEKFPPFNISAYYIHGKLVSLQDVTYYPNYNINIMTLSMKKYRNILDLFDRVESIRPLFENYNDNPWFGFDLSYLTFEFRDIVKSEFEEIISLIYEIEKYSLNIQEQISLNESLTFFQITKFFQYSTKQNNDFLLFDLEGLLLKFNTEYKSFLRFLKSNYKNDKKKIRFLLGIGEKLTYIDYVKIIENAYSFKRLLKISNLSNWDLINSKTSWNKVISLHSNFYQELNKIIDKYNSKISYLRKLFPKIDSVIFNKELENIPFETIVKWLERKIVNIDKIDDWDSIDSIRLEFNELNIENLFKIALQHQTKIQNLKKSFERFFYTKYLDEIYRKNPTLSRLKTKKLASILEKFKIFDKEHIKTSRKRILYQLWDMRPKNQWVMAESSSINILKKELIKKRRIKPIRKLFSEIPVLINSLKPCLLMSPLSISKYLNPKIYKFDIVIFDEASQVKPEDSIGAIMRGNQTIIVGDRKQLPPTTFFQATSSEYDEEDYDDIDFESILDRFSLSNYPELMLNHHYRSRDETLIAFSNYHFYDNRLYTFPSVLHRKDKIGIEFEYVPNGIYDRGKSRRNRVEAKRVATLILKHFKTNPQYSLGVIAFSQAQQDAITIELESLLRSNIEYEKYIQNGGLEHFFVKSLENVQGDERDVIFFSIGYGKDLDGRLSLNFGPLNRIGGERRLNVAITRARYRVVIISSIYSAEIDISRTRSEGIKLLKQYLEFAENKGMSSFIKGMNTSFDEDFDSPFEAEVYKALTNAGCTVHTQIGCSGFKIDMGIIHPLYPGRYIIGIECDGSQYHSSFTARDRDRIRQDVLESLGWNIHRIWSYDWIANPQKELAKIMDKLKSLESKKIKIFKDKNSGDFQTNFNDKEFNIQDFNESFNIKKRNINFENLPADFTEYRKYNERNSDIFKYQYHSHGAYHYYSKNAIPLIKKIVFKESPIHINELFKRISDCCRYTRLGPKMKSTIETAIYSASDITRRGNTIWRSNQKEIPVRYPKQSQVKRKIIHIPIEEIAQAICYLIRDSISLNSDETVLYAGKIFGFSSVSGKSKECITNAVNLLLNKDKIIKKGDKFMLKERNNFKLTPSNL